MKNLLTEYSQRISFYVNLAGSPRGNKGVKDSFLGQIINSYNNALTPFLIIDHSTMDYLYASENMRRQLGYSSKELVKGGMELTLETLHPEDVDRLTILHSDLFKIYYSIPESKRSNYKFTYESRLKRTDGKYVWIMQEVFFPVCDENNNPLLSVTNTISIDHIKLGDTITLTAQRYDEKNCSFIEFSKKYPLEDNIQQLTPRELEILQMISEGYLTKEIADKLYVSILTVNKHRQNMLRKTNAGTISELVGNAKDWGLL